MKSVCTKFQIRNRMFIETWEDYNLILLRELVLKDFQRLEKLLNLDLPIVNLQFDYSQIDEFSQSLLIDIPLEHQDAVTTYLASNYYQLTPIGGLVDPLMRINAVSRLLKPKQVFVHMGRHLVFDAFGTKYRGYLDESPGRPGLHYDYQKMLCRDLKGEHVEVATNDFSFADNLNVETEMLTLNPDWKWEIIEEHSYIGSLPPTKYFEGDVVTITDKQHPSFCTNEADNQCLVFRISWNKDPLLYQIKLPNKEIVEATAEQLSLQAKGITRLYYNGTPPVQWRDLKSEAEFYLLLGLFRYHYNSGTDSYNWTMPQARKAIKNGEGHGVLRWKGANFLISYLTGEEVTFEPKEVADATLAIDLVLSL